MSIHIHESIRMKTAPELLSKVHCARIPQEGREDRITISPCTGNSSNSSSSSKTPRCGFDSCGEGFVGTESVPFGADADEDAAADMMMVKDKRRERLSK